MGVVPVRARSLLERMLASLPSPLSCFSLASPLLVPALLAGDRWCDPGVCQGARLRLVRPLHRLLGQRFRCLQGSYICSHCMRTQTRKQPRDTRRPSAAFLRWLVREDGW